MRKTSQVEDFPFTARHCCLFEIKNNGEIEQIKHYRKMDYDNVLNAYKRVINNKSKLYYVWPGQYTSDLFEVDDLTAFSSSFGINF